MLERELKLTAPNPAVLDAILASSLVNDVCLPQEEKAPQQFLGIYYDTRDHAFDRHRCSLRARREGTRFRAALKLAGSIVDGWSQREEFEEDIEGWLETPDDLPESQFKQRVTQVVALNEPLIPRVTVDMSRAIRNLEVEGSLIELVADRGVIRAAKGEQVLYEIELELKRGDPDVVLQYGKQLQGQFDLRFSVCTKHSIGLSLC